MEDVGMDLLSVELDGRGGWDGLGYLRDYLSIPSRPSRPSLFPSLGFIDVY